jgi:chromosome segregation ATPase
MDTLEEKNRILETENEHMYERVKKDADNCKRMLLEIFDRVDAKTSKALVNPSIEQLHSLVSAKIEEVTKKVDEKAEEVSGAEQRRWKDLRDQEKYIESLEKELTECKNQIVRLKCDNRILSEQESPGTAGQNDRVRELQKEMDELADKYQRAANENADLLK